jgi:hypothetical protein
MGMMNIRFILFIFIILFAGCSSLSLQRARTEFYSGNFVQADQILKECNEISERTRLLCYAEKGLILHYLEEYEKSTQILLKASQFIQKEDQISISDQSSAIMINDMASTYKGEYCERLWIHTFLMMNFLLLYQYESALVEAKQALEVYNKYPGSLEDDYFTRALIALCFENMNLWDDARIEYEKLTESMGGDYFMPEPITPGKGELVLFIGQGRVPTKVSMDAFVPPSIRISIPRYTDSFMLTPFTIQSDGRIISFEEIITNLGDVAQKSLNDRAAQYLTRQALRVGVKETIAREIGESSEFGEVVARTILFLLEEADTRSWEILPGGLTLIRIVLDTGFHDLEISSEYSETIYLNGIDIPEGRRVYQSLRF